MKFFLFILFFAVQTLRADTKITNLEMDRPTSSVILTVKSNDAKFFLYYSDDLKVWHPVIGGAAWQGDQRIRFQGDLPKMLFWRVTYSKQ